MIIIMNKSIVLRAISLIDSWVLLSKGILDDFNVHPGKY